MMDGGGLRNAPDCLPHWDVPSLTGVAITIHGHPEGI